MVSCQRGSEYPHRGRLRANRVVPRTTVRPYGTGFFYVAANLDRQILADGKTLYGETP